MRVKNIDRLNIPGSFVVKLLADGEPIAQRAFFQPKAPRNCENCRPLSQAGNPTINARLLLDDE